MEQRNLEALIPENTIGKPNDITYSITADSTETAVDIFKRAYMRLLNVALWHQLCGFASATFALVGRTGGEVYRLAEIGDYIRIDIPGPGSITGNGYDWVR